MSPSALCINHLSSLPRSVEPTVRDVSIFAQTALLGVVGLYDSVPSKLFCRRDVTCSMKTVSITTQKPVIGGKILASKFPTPAEETVTQVRCLTFGKVYETLFFVATRKTPKRL